MSKRQRYVLLGGIALFVLMGIFPPWRYVSYLSVPREPRTAAERLDAARGRPKRRTTLEIEEKAYAPIFSPPGARSRIDLAQLSVQWIVLGAVTAGAVLTLKRNGHT
jgi:hypothetical protein